VAVRVLAATVTACLEALVVAAQGHTEMQVQEHRAKVMLAAMLANLAVEAAVQGRLAAKVQFLVRLSITAVVLAARVHLHLLAVHQQTMLAAVVAAAGKLVALVVLVAAVTVVHQQTMAVLVLMAATELQIQAAAGVVTVKAALLVQGVLVL
jgi:hypothetical protein